MLLLLQKHNSPLQTNANLLNLFHLTLSAATALHRLSPINLEFFSTSSIQHVDGRHFCLISSVFAKATFFGKKSIGKPGQMAQLPNIWCFYRSYNAGPAIFVKFSVNFIVVTNFPLIVLLNRLNDLPQDFSFKNE